MRENNSFLRRLVLLGPLSWAAVAGCTWGSLGSLGAGSGDASLPDTVDGSSPSGRDAGPLTEDSSTTSVVDSSSTTNPNDASGTSIADAGSDAPDAAASPPAAALPIWLDAGAAGWCDTHLGYDFCADFDELPLPSGFSASDGAFLVQTSSVASSAPNDLLLYVPPQGGTGTWGSKLSREFAVNASSIVLAFDIDPAVVSSTSSGMLFAGLDFLGNASAKYSIRLAFNQGLPRLEESYLGSPADVYHSNFTLPPQVWSRIQVEITFATPDDAGDSDAGVSTEAIYVNGVLQGIPEQLAPPAGFDPQPNLLVGAVYGTSPTNEWVLRYDNVTLNIH